MIVGTPTVAAQQLGPKVALDEDPVVDELTRRRKIAAQEAILHTVSLTYDLQAGTSYSGVVSTERVDVGDGQVELVDVDTLAGPKAFSEREAGKFVDFRMAINASWDVRMRQNRLGRSWADMTSTERKVAIELTARYNRRLRDAGRLPGAGGAVPGGAVVNPNPFGRMLASRRTRPGA
uniref:Uncharacterized protein n=1 Tax=Pfiesteria piscicida TaxID=71001 RepID=A3E3P9_PFIPI|nr:unknown [Pfiesteria piscicida]